MARRADGMVVLWQMNGLSSRRVALDSATVPTSWSMLDGHGDYNGDGKSDILWRDARRHGGALADGRR